VDAGRFGNAFMVDTGMAVVPELGSQYSYGAASNGDGWRVMWSDDNDYSVRTSGIGSDGTLLDPSGSLFGYEQVYTSGLNRSLTGTGSGFLAVWIAGFDRSIWAARLDSAGVPLDSFLIHDSASGQYMPAVAFDGDSTCLVVWAEDPYGNSDVYAARVTTGGRVLDGEPFPVAQKRSQIEGTPTVAFGQGVYLVAWTSVDTSYTMAVAKAARVSADGVVLDTAIFLRHSPAMMQGYPAVAFGDTCFLASWSEGLEEPDIYAARVSVSGNLIDPTGMQLCSGPTYDMYSSVGFDGTTYLVMWSEGDTTSSWNALRGRRVTHDGVPLDSSLIRPQLAGHSCSNPSVAADQANFLVAFGVTDTLTFEEDICCVRISPGGAVLDSGTFLPLGVDEQSGPSGASDGTDFLAAWFETQVQGNAVSAARISADGTVLDPVGFTVNAAPGNKQSLATGFGDSLYLVAWADSRNTYWPDIYCARVSLDGHVLDTNGIAVCTESLSQDYPDIGYDGQNFIVVWQDNRSATSNSIYAARVSPSGVVLDPNGFVVAAADTFDDHAPAVCYTGTDNLVVWFGTDLPYQRSYRVYGALVSPTGQITKPRFVVNDAGTSWVGSPAVAHGTANSLAAWVDLSSGAIRAARVRADGTVLDTAGFVVDTSSDFGVMPRVTANPTGFKVLWDSYDMDTTRFAVTQIDTAGHLVRSGEWFGVAGPHNGYDAVYGGGPDLLLIFSCLTDTAQGRYYGTDRLWGRLGQVPGVQEVDTRQLRKATSGATIVRGVLVLGAVDSRQQTTDRTELLDAAGRKVAELRAGANDVSALSPGVYFVRGPETDDGRPAAVRKIVLTE
jgi:hypothetical protein